MLIQWWTLIQMDYSSMLMISNERLLSTETKLPESIICLVTISAHNSAFIYEVEFHFSYALVVVPLVWAVLPYCIRLRFLLRKSYYLQLIIPYLIYNRCSYHQLLMSSSLFYLIKVDNIMELIIHHLVYTRIGYTHAKHAQEALVCVRCAFSSIWQSGKPAIVQSISFHKVNNIPFNNPIGCLMAMACIAHNHCTRQSTRINIKSAQNVYTIEEKVSTANKIHYLGYSKSSYSYSYCYSIGYWYYLCY